MLSSLVSSKNAILTSMVIILCGSSYFFLKNQRSKRKYQESRKNLLDLIGNTPLVLIPSLSKETSCEIYAKCEFLNPCGSSKDRVAKEILLDAIRKNKLKTPGGVVIEASSGSTGISLTRIAKSLGCDSLIVIPNDQAKEKINLIQTLGGQVDLVKPAAITNPENNVNIARKRASEIENGFFVDQFENELNFKAHLTTGAEIWEQTNGKIDAFVMGAGTGGTIGGVASFLKSKKENVKIVLADPQGSSLFSAVKHGVLYTSEQSERTLKRHRIDTIVEGVGLDRMTKVFARALPFIDEAFKITDKEVVAYAKRLLLEDGFFVGSSSAMNCAAAVQTARLLGPGHVIVTVFCSSGEREITKVHSKEFCEKYELI